MIQTETRWLLIVRTRDGQWINAPMVGLLDDHGDALDELARVRERYGYHNARATEVEVPASVEHVLAVTYTTDDDGVHLRCACGWYVVLPHETPLEVFNERASDHLSGIED